MLKFGIMVEFKADANKGKIVKNPKMKGQGKF